MSRGPNKLTKQTNHNSSAESRRNFVPSAEEGSGPYRGNHELTLQFQPATEKTQERVIIAAVTGHILSSFCVD